MLPKYCKECKLQGHDHFECWRLHPELYVERENSNQAVNANVQTNASAQPLMILSSGKVVGDLHGNTKEQWKEVRDNRVRNGVNPNADQGKTGKEIVLVQQSGDQLANGVNKDGNTGQKTGEQRDVEEQLSPVGNETSKQVQVANKFAVLEVIDEEDEPGNQLALVEASATPKAPGNGNQDERQKHTGNLNPAAPAFTPNSSGIGSANDRVNTSPKGKAKEIHKTKESTAQWVERTFNTKTGEGSVGINISYQDIPSQDTMVDKELAKSPALPDGTKFPTLQERVQWRGGRLWSDQREEDSEADEVPEGAKVDEEPVVEEQEEEEQSVNDHPTAITDKSNATNLDKGNEVPIDQEIANYTQVANSNDRLVMGSQLEEVLRQ